MSIHQCPKCELKFAYKTELDDHCWHDHPEFRHDYPATAPPPVVVDEPPRPAPALPEPEHQSLSERLGGWLAPSGKKYEEPAD